MLHRVIIATVLLTMTVATTWPLATRLTHRIPQGAESSPTVPIFNLWTVGWNLDRVCHGWRSYWNAPHFFPAEQSLALSEPLIASQAFLGFAWFPPAVAYNLFLFTAVGLNAGTTWLALRQRRVSWLVSFLASFAMVRLPFVNQHLGLIQCVLVAGMIGTIHFGEQALMTGRRSRWWLAAACFDLTYLACGYYAVFLVLLMPLVAAVWLWPRVWPFVIDRAIRSGGSHDSTLPVNRMRTREWIWSGSGTALLLAAIVPVACVQSRVLSEPKYERTRVVIQELSARPTDYLAAPFPEWFEFVGHSQWHEAGRWKLSPGLLKVVLALFGVVLGVQSRSRRNWALTWLAVCIGAYLGSLGLNLQFAGWSPYSTLLDWIPTLTRLRTPARMAVLVQIAVVFLAAEAMYWVFRHARVYARRRGQILQTIFPFGLIWMIGLAVCFEVPLPRRAFVEIPPLQSQSGWIDWLKNHTPEDTVIAHVPFPKGPLPRDYESEAWAMYWGLFHHRRMVNGYSGFFPSTYLNLKASMQTFPDNDSFAALQTRGVRYCIASQFYLDQLSFSEQVAASIPWEPVFHDRKAGVVIFRVAPP